MQHFENWYIPTIIAILAFVYINFKLNKIMADLTTLNAKVDELQASVDAKQAQLEATIAALEAAKAALELELANSVTPEQTQAVIDRIDTVIADVNSTPA